MNASEEIPYNISNVVHLAIETTTLFDQDAYLESQLGPKRRDFVSRIVLTIVYIIIFCTGVFGNICTCVVISRNNHMHTATNYYLFNLAISDLAILILGQTLEFFSLWQSYPFQLGEVLCIFKCFIHEATVSASALTITAFTIERFVAICHPLRSQTMSTLSRAVKIIVLLWCVAIAFAIPYGAHARIVELDHPHTNQSIPESATCSIPRKWIARMTVMFQLSAFLFFITPMVVITLLYALIGITLRKSDVSRQASQFNQSSQRSSNTSGVVRMLVAVVVAFFVCWAPYHAQRLMSIYVKEWTSLLDNIVTVLYDVSGVTYLISSTVNPILYNLMSRKYRKAFKDTICRCCYKSLRAPNSYRFRLSDRSSHLTNSTILRNHSGENSPALPGQRHWNPRLSKRSSGNHSSLIIDKTHMINGQPNSPPYQYDGVSKKSLTLQKLESKDSIDSNIFLELQSEYKERSNNKDASRHKNRESATSQQMLLRTDNNENQIPESPMSDDVFPEENEESL